MTRSLLARATLITVLVAAGAGLSCARAAERVALALEPTEWEQYLLELVNRARANPAAEAARFKIDLNEGPPSETLGAESRQPLAFQMQIQRAARQHTEDNLAHYGAANFRDGSCHVGSDGRTVTQRLQATGVAFTALSENMAWVSSAAMSRAAVEKMHSLLFKDFMPGFQVVGRGHRVVLLRAARNEAGFGTLCGGPFGGTAAAVCTEDFITTGHLYITGVAYSDTVRNDDFYTPGEGLRGITISATPTSARSPAATVSTTTMLAGGYGLEVTPGTWDVTAFGGPLTVPATLTGVVVTDRNVKVDVTADSVKPGPMPAFVLLAASGKVVSPGTYRLGVSKCTVSNGERAFTQADLDALVVEVDGVPFFALANRAKTKPKVERATGAILGVTITDTSRNTLTIDLSKRTLVMNLLSAPGIDPTNGVDLAVGLADFAAGLHAGTKVAGTKVTVYGATGEVVFE